MATTKSKIKQTKEDLEQLHSELQELKLEVNHPEFQEDKEYLKDRLTKLRDELAGIMALREEWSKQGLSNLPNLETGTACHLLVAEISNMIGGSVITTSFDTLGRTASVPIVTTSGITDLQLFKSKDPIASAPPSLITCQPGPSGVLQGKQSDIITTAKIFTPKAPSTLKSIFKPILSPIISKPTVQFQTQHTPITTSQTQLFETIDFTNPIQDRQYQETIVHPPPVYPFQYEQNLESEPRYTRPFNLKWADKVPKFDGSYINFHSFINTFNHHVHCTDCDESGKLLILTH